MTTHTLSLIGLVSNTIGATLAFFFGYPQPSFEAGVSLGVSGPEVDQHNETVQRKKAIYSRLSKTGLAFMTLGFVLQLVAALDSRG